MMLLVTTTKASNVTTLRIISIPLTTVRSNHIIINVVIIRFSQFHATNSFDPSNICYKFSMALLCVYSVHNFTTFPSLHMVGKYFSLQKISLSSTVNQSQEITSSEHFQDNNSDNESKEKFK